MRRWILVAQQKNPRAVGSRPDVHEEPHGLDEFQSIDDHHEIDGVEVLSAGKTASEVRVRIRCGFEFAAAWAEESHLALRALHRQGEDRDNPHDRALSKNSSDRQLSGARDLMTAILVDAGTRFRKS